MSESDLPDIVECCGFNLHKSRELSYSYSPSWNNTSAPPLERTVFKPQGVAGRFLSLYRNGPGWWAGRCEIPGICKIVTASTLQCPSPEDAARVLENLVFDHMSVTDTLQQWFTTERLKRERP